MKQFVLIDPAWHSDGDHHGEFGTALVQGAVQRGVRTRVAVHRSFRGNVQALAPAECIPLFADSSYQSASLLAGMQAIKRGGWARPQPPLAGWSWRAWRARCQNGLARRRRRVYADRLAQSLSLLFADHSFAEPTTVLFASVTDLDLEGIGTFLRAHPQTIQAHWHFLFHFNLLHGRPGAYPPQRWRLSQLRDRILQALAGLPYHPLHFHATTDNLCDQYNRLQVARFTEFPYPISHLPDATSDDDGSSHRPLRFSCLGSIRREKQQRSYLQLFVDQIWERHLQNGRAILQVQASAPRGWWRSKLFLSTPDGRQFRPEPDDSAPWLGTAGAARASDQRGQDSPRASGRGDNDKTHRPIRFAPHPLPRDRYAGLLRATDCGLLLYDAETYFTRRAGIFDELAAWGRPVIVPAGSWLADQLSIPQFDYIQKLTAHAQVTRCLGLADVDCPSGNLPLSGGVMTLDQDEHPFEVSFAHAPGDYLVIVQFQWRYPLEHGSYVRVSLRHAGDVSGPSQWPSIDTTSVLGHPRRGTVAGAMLRIPPGARPGDRLTLRLSNAFESSAICLEGLQLFTLAADDLPLSAAGLTICDRRQLPGAVDEMLRHREHYRRTAESAAERRRRDHEPGRVIEWLAEHRATARRAA